VFYIDAPVAVRLNEEVRGTLQAKAARALQAGEVVF
jgi:hypothetical protein